MKQPRTKIPTIQSHQTHFTFTLLGHLHHLTGIFSLIGIITLGILTLCPITPQTTHAATTKITVKSESSVSVATTSDVTLSPTTDSPFLLLGNTSVQVNTNNPTDYKIYMQTSDGTANLTNVNDAAKAITSIASATKGIDMTGNTWGYAFSNQGLSTDSIYNPILTHGSSDPEIYNTTTAPTADQQESYQLGFAAHLDGNLPAGNYTNTIIISILANTF